jgi:NADH-quinone oxidoreductase subunit C
LEDLGNRFSESIKSKIIDRKIVKIEVDKNQMKAIARYLLERQGWDHVRAVTGVDLSRTSKKENVIEVIYHLGSYTHENLWDADLAVSCKLDAKSPVMDSLTIVWPSCEYHEREVYEMLGVRFVGHPNLSKLLLPEYWSDIPPMLKSYEPAGR